MLKINVLTLFPSLFEEHLKNLPVKKAIQNALAQVNLVNLRNFALDGYGTVDDKPYGGGVGMILMIEPIFNALTSVLGKNFNTGGTKNGRIIALSPRGKTYSQEIARELSQEKQITLICGRYEGMDARIEEHLATDVISIGNYVLSGGELAALSIIESTVRLLPGVLAKPEATQIESFSEENYLEKNYIEYPQYTRPEFFKGMTVPKILLSGNHKEIADWRAKKSHGKL